MKPVRSNKPPNIGFVFTGQGAQWWAMGRELIWAYPIFRDTLVEAERCLIEFGATYSLIEELHRDASSTRVNEAALGQPVCVAVQIALVRLLESFGVRPAAVTSHSSGEIASAYAAGALSLRNAMGVVYARGKLAADVSKYSDLGPGGMIAVGLGFEEAEKYVARVSAGKVVVACRNSPESVTVSGDLVGVEEIEKLLKADNIFARRLLVPTGYHSHHMEPIAEPYAAWLREHIKPEAQMHSIIYSSPTTGGRITSVEEIASAEHWVKSLTNPVLFVQSFTNMCFAGPDKPSDVDMVIELGGHSALSGPIAQIKETDAFHGTKIGYGSCLIRKKNAIQTIQSLVCELAQSGYPIDMGGVNLTSFGQRRVLTDLPKYAWNHQSRHWYEPRTNRAHRMLSEGPHDLLGSLITGTNRISPSWRNVIKPSSLPWINDHKLQGTTIYPGAGFICMAIEGLLQAEQANTDTVSGFRLRDIDILQALVIPEGEDGIEVQLVLRPCSEKAIYAQGFKEFQVFSVTHDDKWSEHCRGLITLEDSSKLPPRIPLLSTPSEYRVRVSPSDVYASMHRVGIQHGPIFQNLKAVRAKTQGSMATIDIIDTAAIMPVGFEHAHVIHPTTLDTVFQAVYAALPEAGARMVTAQVPRSIRNLWVSNKISTTPGSTLQAFSTVRDHDRQGFKAAVTVVGEESAECVIEIEDFRFQSIGLAQASGAQCENDKMMSAKWVPDLSLMPMEKLKSQLAMEPDLVEAEALVDLRHVCAWFLEDALAALTPLDVQNLRGHLKRYYAWMKLQVLENKARDATSQEKAALTAKVAARSVNGELVCCLGPYLSSILRGQQSPLALLEENQILHRYYAEGLKLDRSRRQMAEIVRLYALKNPRSKILEIGAGSGGATAYILNALGRDDPLVASYDFTDLSENFFDAANEDFQAWKNVMSVKKLDIEQDPTMQGFEVETYDLVIACQVLHRTTSLDETMGNVRKLLKPGGRLFIMEPTKDQLDFRLAFGLLPDHWLGEEEHRLMTPTLTAELWNDVLRRSGFTGVDIDLHDCEDDTYSYSVIMSCAGTATSTDALIVPRQPDVIVATGEPAPPQAWIDDLCSSLGSLSDASIKVQAYQTLGSEALESKVVIFLGEVSAPILKDPSKEQFDAIRNLCTKSKGVLWVTCGGAVESTDPWSSLSQGFLRILRLEYVGKRLGSLDLEFSQNPWSASAALAITSTFESLFADEPDNAPRDFEFAERDGSINVLRYFKDRERNCLWFPDPSESIPTELRPFKDGVTLSIENPGHLDSLVFKPRSVDPEALSTDELEIAPQAFGISNQDVSAATSAHHDRLMGFECAGVVTAVGSAAQREGFKLGDRVAALVQGECSSSIRIPCSSAVQIPDDMGFVLGAALPIAYATAWISLIDTARIEPGESVLIHDAGSAVGQAACAIAQYIGAEVYTTVSSLEHGSFLKRVLSVPADHIFSTNDANFAAKLRGMDVVLNSLDRRLLQESMNCIAPLGRFIELGRSHIEQNSRLDMGAFARGTSFSAIDMAIVLKHKPQQVSTALKKSIHLIKTREMRGVLTSTHDISDVVQAFRNAQLATSPGRVVLCVKPDSMVQVSLTNIMMGENADGRPDHSPGAHCALASRRILRSCRWAGWHRSKRVLVAG